jgi:hypothetical protein
MLRNFIYCGISAIYAYEPQYETRYLGMTACARIPTACARIPTYLGMCPHTYRMCPHTHLSGHVPAYLPHYLPYYEIDADVGMFTIMISLPRCKKGPNPAYWWRAAGDTSSAVASA